MNIYDFTVKDNKGNDVLLAKYEGKVLLIVNTATGCGFTPQYDELQNLYEEVGSEKLEILDFPCNQFGEQAPGTAEEIESFCTGRYGITFPQFAKIDVNGENAIPLYDYLKSQMGFDGFGKSVKGLGMSAILKKIDKDYKNTPAIKWNFTKFLLNQKGEVVKRFEPTASMADVSSAVKELVNGMEETL